LRASASNGAVIASAMVLRAILLVAAVAQVVARAAKALVNTLTATPLPNGSTNAKRELRQAAEFHAKSEFEHWETAVVKLEVSEVDSAGSSIADKVEDLLAVGIEAPEAPIEGAKGAESAPEVPSSLPEAVIPKVEAAEVAPEATEVPTEEEKIALVSRLDGGTEGSWQSGEHDDGLARAKLAVFVPPAEEHVSEPPPSVDKGSVKNGTDGPEVLLALDHVEEGDQAQGPAATKPVVTKDLKAKIVKQVEVYFSDTNLSTNNYLMKFVKKDPEGFVPILVVALFKKIKDPVKTLD
jgi:hypothetical protein